MRASGVRVVVMGVAGCGKSAVARRLADVLGLPMREGDDFHPAGNVEKMKVGVPLTDDYRVGWLARLGADLAAHPEGVVLSCSALKKNYRDGLRLAAPGLAFVYLHIELAESLRRVASRPGHFYPPSLVASQFEALQDPTGEVRVIRLDATLPLDTLAALAGDNLFNNA